jgi:hypothetical protein
VIEAAVAVGLAARSTGNDIEDLVQATSAEEDQFFFEAMECEEEEPLRGETIQEAFDNLIFMRKIFIWEALTFISKMGGQGFFFCNCKGNCDKNTCKCKKNNREYNSKCHPRNTECTNHNQYHE